MRLNDLVSLANFFAAYERAMQEYDDRGASPEIISGPVVLIGDTAYELAYSYAHKSVVLQETNLQAEED